MMLGKRGRRPPIKRTTSMTEFTLDLNCAVEGVVYQANLDPNNFYRGGSGELYAAPPAASPRPQRRNSADLTQTASFLRTCSLCKRRLIPGRDIYMYRGDTAFCSSECRQQQMTQDERKDKCSLVSKIGASASTAGETVPAV